MASWADVERLATALPEVVEDRGTWRVRKKPIAWERPLRKGDLEYLGEAAPTGPVLGARVADEGDKLGLIAEHPDVFFTTPHFDGYPAILVRLEAIDEDLLEQLLTDAWLAQAPRRLAAEFLAGH